MNNRPSAPQSSGMSIGDIWYVLFRHKWKILFISALAIAAGYFAPYYVPYLPVVSKMELMQPDVFESEARLMIKYVVETKPADQIGEKDPSTSQVAQGDGVITTEMDILTSMDLALQTARVVGVERILAPFGGGTNEYRAASEVRRGLEPQLNKYSKVVRVKFRHPDPQVAQLVLRTLVDEYRTKHSDVHVANLDPALLSQISSLRQDLTREENKLRSTRTNLSLLTVDAAKKAHSESISRLTQNIFDVELQLAERSAALTNMMAAFPQDTPEVTNAVPAPAAPESSSEYSRVLRHLDSLYARENDLLMQFNSENALVKGIQAQIVEQENLRKNMEDANPALLAMGSSSGRGGDPRLNARMTMAAELATIRALETRRAILVDRLRQLNEEAKGFPDDTALADLQRKRETLEYLSASLDRSKIDQALASGNVLNIATVQEPSTPSRVPSKLGLVQWAIGIGGVAFAIGLAFLLEMYVDQSVRRATDVQLKIGAPLLMTIPRLRINGHSRALSAPKRPMLENGGATPSSAVVPVKRNGKHPAPWEAGHPLFAFAEALRDRLITWFEVRELTHKPKLVAVTSCAEGSGVSTVASGLAASLSETGDGNVLLVDMNQRNGSSRQFHKGELAMDIDDALETDIRAHAMVQDKLYVVSESKESGQLAGALPKRFRSLVPKLKASDYDYIIFDMPPVSQISLTPRLAKFMDMVLMVVESEETDKHVVTSACNLLAESKANVGIVLNKARNYVPRKLVQRL